jgi:hypothetical protein
MTANQNRSTATAGIGDDGRSGTATIRMRALGLGLFLAVVICAVTPFNNAYRHATPLGGGHFPLAPFFILMLLTLLFAGASRLCGRRDIVTGRELIVIWVLMVLVSGIAWTGLVRTFFVNLTAPYHFASVENRWQEVLHPLLPAALYPSDPAAISGLYEGLAGGRQMGWFEVLQRLPWHAWSGPLALWGLFIILCYLMIISLVSLLSHQWMHNERINFPLLQVPLLMGKAYEENRLANFFLDRFLLAGLLIPVLLHLINGLHFYIPAVPQIPTLILTGSYFPKYGLFSAFYKLKIYIYPAFIGFAFLTTRQISFSFWFFFFAGALFIGLLNVLGYNIPAAALGVTFGPTLTRPEETQMIGAFLVFFLFLVWLARRHILDVVRQSIGLAGHIPQSSGWVPTPVAFWAFITGMGGIVFWCNWFGMPLFACLLLAGAFLVLTVVTARVVTQGGIAYFTVTAAPMDGLLAFLGPRMFAGVGILIAAVVQKVMFVDMRESLIPSAVHARKVSRGIENRTVVLGAVLLALLAAVAVSMAAMLALSYKFGIRELSLDWATGTTVAVYEKIFTLVESPIQPGEWVRIFSVVGGLVMLALVLCYQRFHWWPIHPIGYLTAYSSGMRILWFSFLLGWIANALCMRYGGVVLFRRLRLFFVGLIIGDFLMGGVWAIIGLLMDTSYQVLPT